MEPRFALPAELVEGTSVSSNEYGWPPRLFPEAAHRAESLGYACLGGQFQFHGAFGTCEMYWLSADSRARRSGEPWTAYCERSPAEVLDAFHQIMDQTDFNREAMHWPALKTEEERGFDVLGALVFVAYFVTEQEMAC